MIKVCSKCKISKEASAFTKDSSTKDGLYPYCKECKNKIEKNRMTPERKEKNRIRSLIHAQIHKIDAVKRATEWVFNHKEHVAKYQKEYKQKHKEELNRKQRERNRKNYRSKRDKFISYWHARKARKLLNGGTYTAEQWRKMRVHFGNKCLRCGSGSNLSVDHVIPLCKGGKNDISNIQPLCISCNASKQGKVIDYRDPELLEQFLSTL